MKRGRRTGIVKALCGAAILVATGWLGGDRSPASACPEGTIAAAACDSVVTAMGAVAAPDTTASAYALHELSASGIRMFPAAAAAYDVALGSIETEPWLTELDGPSAPNQVVVVDATEYLLASACKNHDCAENNVVLLYSAELDVVYGLVYRSGDVTWIGAPTETVAQALREFWRQAFRD